MTRSLLNTARGTLDTDDGSKNILTTQTSLTVVSIIVHEMDEMICVTGELVTVAGINILTD